MGWMWSPRELCVRMTCLRLSNTHHPACLSERIHEYRGFVQWLGALPARFRRERLLIVGCGDVGMRVARNYAQGAGAGRVRVMALTSSPERKAALRGCLSRRSWETWISLPRCAAWLGWPRGCCTWPHRPAKGWARRVVARSAHAGTGPRAAHAQFANIAGVRIDQWVYGDCAGRWCAKRAPWRPLPHAPSAVWMPKPLCATWAAQGACQHSAHSGHLRA